jgi:hypothetical protein
VLQQLLGGRNGLHVAKGAMTTQPRRDGDRLHLEATQMIDGGGIGAQQPLGINGLGRLQRPLEDPHVPAVGAIGADGLANAHAPGFDTRFHFHQHIGQEALIVRAAGNDGPNALGGGRGGGCRMHAKHGAHFVGGDRSAIQLLVGRELVERSLELPHVAEREARHLVEHPIGEGEGAVCHDIAKNGETHFEVGRPHIHHEPARQPREEALVDIGDLRWLAIAREDQLLATAEQHVEQPPQFTLRLLLTGQELHIIEDEQIRLREWLEQQLRLSRCHGAVQQFGDFFTRRAAHTERRLHLADTMGDGRDEMRLAKPRPPVDEERVVGLPGGVRHRASRRDSQPVRGAHHICVESQGAIHAAGHAATPAPVRTPCTIGASSAGAYTGVRKAALAR